MRNGGADNWVVPPAVLGLIRNFSLLGGQGRGEVGPSPRFVLVGGRDGDSGFGSQFETRVVLT